MGLQEQIKATSVIAFRQRGFLDGYHRGGPRDVNEKAAERAGALDAYRSGLRTGRRERERKGT